VRQPRLLLAFLIAAHCMLLLAGFLSPYDPAQQNRDYSYVQPMSLHLIQPNGSWSARPFVYGLRPRSDDASRYEEDRSQIFPVRVFVRGADYSFFGMNARLRLVGTDEGGHLFLLGTDQFGRDVLSRLLYGGQISLFAGLFATVLSVGVGSLLGGIAGFYGRWTDIVIMRGADLFLALPWFYLLFAVRAFLPLQLDPAVSFLIIVALIGMVGWAGPAKLVRGVTLSAKERNFVLAAWKFGASPSYILRRHVLPQTWSVVLTQAAVLVPQYVLAEITLSFLGLGVAEPVPSWGNMLSSVQQYSVLSSYWWMLTPGVALLPISLAYFLLASNLQSRIKSEQV
jgi:peptide/nickel transport system permease protein